MSPHRRRTLPSHTGALPISRPHLSHTGTRMVRGHGASRLRRLTAEPKTGVERLTVGPVVCQLKQNRKLKKRSESNPEYGVSVEHEGDCIYGIRPNLLGLSTSPGKVTATNPTHPQVEPKNHPGYAQVFTGDGNPPFRNENWSNEPPPEGFRHDKYGRYHRRPPGSGVSPPIQPPIHIPEIPVPLYGSLADHERAQARTQQPCPPSASNPAHGQNHDTPRPVRRPTIDAQASSKKEELQALARHHYDKYYYNNQYYCPPQDIEPPVIPAINSNRLASPAQFHSSPSRGANQGRHFSQHAESLPPNPRHSSNGYQQAPDRHPESQYLPGTIQPQGSPENRASGSSVRLAIPRKDSVELQKETLKQHSQKVVKSSKTDYINDWREKVASGQSSQ